jgi:hypothetical protein
MEMDAKTLLDSVNSTSSQLAIQSKTCEALRDDVESRDAEIVRMRDYYKAQKEALIRESNELQDGRRDDVTRLENVIAEHVTRNKTNEKENQELSSKFEAVSKDYTELENARFLTDQRESDARESEERENDKIFFDLANVKDDLARVQEEKDILVVRSCFSFI